MSFSLSPSFLPYTLCMSSSRTFLSLGCTGFLLGLVVFLGVRSYDGNVSALLHMDTEFGARIGVPAGIVLYQDGGYDGMAYYQIARDLPSLFQPDALPFHSAYRFQRIVLPLFAYLVSFGNERWLPWAFLIINVFAALGSLFLALRISTKLSIHAFAVVLNPAMLVGILYSLTEPVSLFFLMAFFWLWNKKERLDVASLSLLSLSLFARETTVFLIFFLFLWLCLKRRWLQAFCSLVPVGLFFLWQWFLVWRFSELGVETGGSMVNLPFTGIVSLFQMAWSEIGVKQLYRFTSLALLAFVLPLTVVVFRDWLSQGKKISAFTFFLSGLLGVMFCMDAHIWGVITSIGRVVTPVYPVYFMYAIQKDTVALRVLSGVLVVLSVVSAVGIASMSHPFVVS